MGSASGAQSIFASRAFRRYFAGQSLSYIGDGLRMLSVPLLAYHLTHSALSTGAALICEIAPFSLFALVGGSLADRLDRRRLMIGCDAVRFAVMALFAIGYAFHVLTLPMIYGGLVIISICAAGFLGGQSSSIPYLLGRDQATKGIAVLIAAENASNLMTPAIGAALFAYFGPLPALTINALTYLASQLSLARIPSLGPDRVAGLPTLEHLIDDISLGYRHLWGDLGMRAQAFAAFSFNIFGFGGYAILIPFLKKGFEASDQQVGIFFGISALGAIAGASLAARYPDRWPFGRALVIAYLLDALFFLPVVLVSNIWLAALFWATSNALANFEIAQILGFRMRVTPPEMVGRVMGAVRLLVLAGMAPGVLLLGWVADHRSPHAAMSISAGGYVVVALVALLSPSIRNESR
ncbi:MAG TPA: MFS transporter [Candidatus Dormibacteraeota bacterium]|nr:MFS transporter [Candidatus Dormibacteraeota bacterium]